MNIATTTAAVAAAILLSACAGFTAKQVNGEADNEVDGVRYYEVAPYLLVYADGKGGITSSIEMLPDLSRKMVINLHAIASKNNTTLTFANGLLTGSKFVVDDTVVPAAVIETIKTLGVAAVSSAMNDPATGKVRQIPAPMLFKIVIDKAGTTLVGGSGKDKDGNEVVIKVAVTETDVAAPTAGGQK